MTTIIPTPAPVPNPLSSDFGTKAYGFTLWMAEAAPAMTAVAQETNDALNQSLLGVVSTSTSSITIASTGTININVEANKGYAIGMIVKIASTANPANYVKGTVTAYTSSTGAMSVLLNSKGGSGTFANWSVFFDVTDPSILSVPTGDTVASGNLLAIDDSGNSLAVDSITTGIVQAVTATSLHACALSGGNTAIFWTAGSTDLRMMTVSSTGATVLASTSIGTGLSNTQIWAAQLTNGNIVFCYKAITTQYPTFKIINTSGVEVVAATTIESAAANSGVKVCALTGGGFATTYCGASSYPKLAVYTNTGTVTTAVTTIVSAAHSKVSICPRPTGGFATLYGGTTMTGKLYNSIGTVTGSIAFTAQADGEVGIASTTGSIVGANGGTNSAPYAPSILLSTDTGSLVNSASGAIQDSGLVVSFDVAITNNSRLKSSSVTVLGDGSYLALYTAYTTSDEYPRYVNFWGDGTVIRSGYVCAETTYASSEYLMYAMPVGQNGFSLVWAASNRNIKFAHVKSGYVVGVSLGAVGATHQYMVNGSVNLTNANMLNVGGAKVNYKQQGAKVVI